MLLTYLEKQKANENKFDLGALFEFSKIVNSSLDLKFILGQMLLPIMGKLMCSKGIVLLKGAKNEYSVEVTKGFQVEHGREIVLIDKIPKQPIYIDKENTKKYTWLKYFKHLGFNLVIPIRGREKILGVVGFTTSAKRKKPSVQELTYIDSLINITASAIEKSLNFNEVALVNRRMDGKIQELNTLFELSKEFNSILDENKIVKLLVYSIIGHIGVNRYFVCLNKNGDMVEVSSRLEKQLSPAVFKYFCHIASPIVLEELDSKKNRDIKNILNELGIQVIIPFRMKNETKGVVGLGEKMRGDKYTSTDLDFLLSLANLAIISLENARLFQEAVEKQKLENELLIAREIQRGLLPSKLPEINNFQLDAINISSKQVGGDYYDVIPLGNSKYLLAIADVSGKGTPASLLMSNLQATVHALIPLGLSLPELTKRINDLICENTSSDRFITFFWGILNSETKVMKYVNAGHNPPILINASKEIKHLDKGGIILGIMKALVPYEEGEIHFEEGEMLVLFTDGVSEAMNVKGEELGEERLEEILLTNINESPSHILSHIVKAVETHSSNIPQSDDITLVVLKATA